MGGRKRFVLQIAGAVIESGVLVEVVIGQSDANGDGMMTSVRLGDYVCEAGEMRCDVVRCEKGPWRGITAQNAKMWSFSASFFSRVSRVVI